MTRMLDIQRLSKRFGPFTAVDDISFSVDRGEVLGFLGPNGAGKSTSMKMVTGYLPPSAGTVLVCGHDVVKSPIEVKQRIGYLPEGSPLSEDMMPAFVGIGAIAFAAVRRRNRSRRHELRSALT